MFRSNSIAAAFLALGSLAQAQVITIGPFSGALSDGIETQSAAGMSGFQPCLVGRAFNNSADVCTPGGSSTHITSSWGYGCSIPARSGSWFLGSTGGGGLEFNFDDPVLRFGSYFGTNTPNAATVSITFLDAGGALIDSTLVNVTNDCNWVWNGWESQGAGISTVQIVNSQYSGGYVMMDDMEADPGGGIGSVGTAYCQAGANSVDAGGALISATGSNSVSAANLELIAAPTPNDNFLFYYGPNQIALPFGNGFRCVGGAVVTMQIITGSGNEMRYVVDLGVHGGAFLTMGTVNFQCWYRDPASGGAFFNLSDGLEIGFMP